MRADTTTYPWREVTRAQMREGRGSVLGGNTTRRARWWDMTLECGHGSERFVRYTPLPPAESYHGGTQARNRDDVMPAPRRVRCWECP